MRSKNRGDSQRSYDSQGGPLYTAFTMERVAEGERATVNALSGVTWNIGWAVCPYLSGVIQERWGFNPLFVATATLYGVGSVLTYWFFGRTTALRDE